MEDPTHSEGILTDLTFLSCVGVRPVVVHGGGKAISKGMRDEGIETRFVKGLRVTCEKSMKVVERVMGTDINPGIVAMIEAGGGVAKGVSGQDVFHVNRKSGIDPDTGEPLDWGFVGEPSEAGFRRSSLGRHSRRDAYWYWCGRKSPQHQRGYGGCSIGESHRGA